MGTLIGIVLIVLSLCLVLLLYWQFHAKTGLHRARFARIEELWRLLRRTPASHGLLLGKMTVYKWFIHVVTVTPTPTRREIGNMLIVAPTRSGKGLLATAQLLTWQHSAIVNDIKGELFAATAGYRSQLGEVFVIDPTGVGHRYDPMFGKQTEDELYNVATQLLFIPHEGEGAIFTQRATTMLAQLFAGARIENCAPFPYVRTLIRSGLPAAAQRLHRLSPELATQFLDVTYTDANFSDRFLLSAWGTLTARMRPLLTETVIRSLTHSDITAQMLLQAKKPVTLYFRWKEQDLLSLSPLVRLVWGSIIDELLTTYDNAAGNNCRPVLMVIDEAGRTAIPSLADHATTVVGRDISLWVALQSLSQLETVYGTSRAQVLRDNMESQLYYRPTDLATAAYLEKRLGNQSAYAHSTTSREGEETSEGRSERPIPLLSAQEILQLKDEDVIGFHRELPPFMLKRIDWRTDRTLQQRKKIVAPTLPILPNVAVIPLLQRIQKQQYAAGYIDPDERV